jgi:hypothetical protein
MAHLIKNTPYPVAIHVRRGDFVILGCDKDSSPEYFYEAINEMKNRIVDSSENLITFFTFSDDISYCKDIFQRMENLVFIDFNDGEKGEEDMYLMSLCKHFILSVGSGFSTWGAFLSSNNSKIVIRPKTLR